MHVYRGTCLTAIDAAINLRKVTPRAADMERTASFDACENPRTAANVVAAINRAIASGSDARLLTVY